MASSLGNWGVQSTPSSLYIVPNMQRLLIIILFMTIVPDVIIWKYIFPDISWVWKILISLPTIAVLILSIGFDKKRFGYLLRKRIFFGCIILLLPPKMLFALVALPFGWIAGCVAACGLIGVFLYGFLYGWKKLEVKEETFAFDNLPEQFDDFKIVQISDLHLGSFVPHPELITHVVDTANAQQADLIVFTGDLVNYKDEEADPFVETLSKLRAKDGVLSILGNHDYYFKSKVMKKEKEIGWRLLFNEHQRIQRGGESIYIIGVEQIGKPPFEAKGQLGKAMAGIPSEAFTILLSHDPSHWRMEVTGKTNIPLTLSGHTHAAQLKIGHFSPASLIYSEWSGLYHDSHQMLYVSHGIGGTIPFRLGAWPEINVIRLKKKQ